MTESRGQISAEYLLVAGVLIFVLMFSAIFIASEQELNIAMTAARNGVNDGAASSSSGIYPKQTYSDYDKSAKDLLSPYSVEIVNLSLIHI